MRAGYTYGPVFTSTAASRDGCLYAAHVERHGYIGPADALGMLGLRVQWGVEGGASRGADPLEPIGASRATLTLRDPGGVLAETSGAPDGAWRLRLERLTGPQAGLQWLGYLQQEAYEDSPYAAASGTALGFSDGFGLLSNRPVAGPGADVGAAAVVLPTADGLQPGRRLLSIVQQHLTDLSADAQMGLVTAVDWRPWLPGGVVSADTDPLRAIWAREDAWLSEDGGSLSALDAIRAIVARFGARLYQSGGRWHVTQRHLLARSVGGGTMPAFVYLAGQSDAVARSLVPVGVDTRDWAQEGPHAKPRRGTTLPVRSVRSIYDFEPDLDNAVTNPSFEAPGTSPDGSPSDEHAYGWEFEDSDGVDLGEERTIRRELANSAIPDLDPTGVDAYDLRLGNGDATNPGGGYARQRDVLFLPASRAWEIRLAFDAAIVEFGADEDAGRPAFWGLMAITGGPGGATWAPVLRRLTCAASELPGADAAVFVRNALQDGAGIAVPDGVAYVPERSVLRWFRDANGQQLFVGTQTLSEPVRGGDSKVRGALDIPGTEGALFSGEAERLRPGDYAEVYVWTRGAASARFDLSGGGWRVEDNGQGADIRLGRIAVSMTGADADGAAVTGALVIQFKNTSVAYFGDIDDVELQLRIGGKTAARSTAVSSLPAGAPGLDIALESSPLGDGPLSSTHGLLFAEVDGGAPQPTLQGANTGWTEGAFAPAEASTGVGVVALHARTSLAQLAGPPTGDSDVSGGGLERARTTYLLRAGETLEPSLAVRHWPLTVLALTATAGTETIYTRAAPRVGGTIAAGGVDYAVTSVTRGAGLYAVEIGAPLAASLPIGARVAYDLHAWWDGFEWDVPGGSALCDGSALDLADPNAFTEELALEAASTGNSA